MELLIKLAERVKFTYDLHLVGDGQFGSLKKVWFTGSEEKLQKYLRTHPAITCSKLAIETLKQVVK